MMGMEMCFGKFIQNIDAQQLLPVDHHPPPCLELCRGLLGMIGYQQVFIPRTLMVILFTSTSLPTIYVALAQFPIILVICHYIGSSKSNVVFLWLHFG